MNLLYISDYSSGTGYGKAAIEFMRSLNVSGVNLFCRPIIFNSSILEKLPSDIEQIEKKQIKDIDVVIQHTLPNHMQYMSKYCNIGMFAYEADSYNGTGWKNQLNCMDEVFVFNKQMLESAKKSGVKKDCKIIPHATNTDKYFTKYNIPSFMKPLKKDNRFIFYTIGEFNRRKNLASLLMSFFLEFGRDENVCLLIKTSCDEKEFFSFCDQISSSLKYNILPQVALVNQRLSEEEICAIHYHSDCFIQTSHGEAWSIPAFEAMCFGKTPIVPASSGYLEYMDEDCGWLIPVSESQVFGMHKNNIDLCRGDEIWWQVDVSKTRQFMREAYTNEDARIKKSEVGISKSFAFSHAEIGKILLENIKWAIERKLSSGKK